MSLFPPQLFRNSTAVAYFLRDKVSTISPLHSQSVKESTLRAYTVSVLRFVDLLSKQNILLYSISDLDYFLSFYTSSSFDDNPRRGERQKCVNSMAGIEFFLPSLQQKLRSTRLSNK